MKQSSQTCNFFKVLSFILKLMKSGVVFQCMCKKLECKKMCIKKIIIYHLGKYVLYYSLLYSMILERPREIQPQNQVQCPGNSSCLHFIINMWIQTAAFFPLFDKWCQDNNKKKCPKCEVKCYDIPTYS
jgi:hypothetical protein